MNWTIHEKVDLSRGSTQRVGYNDALMLPNNAMSHMFQVEVLDEGEPCPLNGYTCTGYFVRQDGVAVLCKGTIEGNVVRVYMALECFAVSGTLRCIIRLQKTDQIMTIFQTFCKVRDKIPDQIVDPGQVVPSVEALMEKLAAVQSETKGYRDDAQSALTELKEGIASGQFKGDKGDPGVSPTISTSKSGKVTTVTIVAADGTHTFTVNDGDGDGDMKMSVYDTDSDGVVDKANGLTDTAVTNLKSSFAAVASSGKYSDLTGRPSIDDLSFGRLSLESDDQISALGRGTATGKITIGSGQKVAITGVVSRAYYFSAYGCSVSTEGTTCTVSVNIIETANVSREKGTNAAFVYYAVY